MPLGPKESLADVIWDQVVARLTAAWRPLTWRSGGPAAARARLHFGETR